MGAKKNIIPPHLFAFIHRLKGALVSGKRSAYMALLIKVIKPVTNIADAFLNMFSSPRNKQEAIPRTIMIVSPPRAGATIIYQTLARVLPGTYLSNLHALFPTQASKCLVRKNETISFGSKNYYGYTAGLYDVYEGNEFIDPLFKGNNDPTAINSKFIRLLQRIKPVPSLPFFLKNARNYHNIELLSGAVPEVFFIRIKRNTEQVIQSELRAHYELKTFHPIPERLKGCSINDPLEFTVKQILEIEREIEEQLQKIDPSRWIEWEYEEFCKDPIKHISSLATENLNIPESEIRKDKLTYDLKISDRRKVSLADEKKISVLIKEIKMNEKL